MIELLVVIGILAILAAIIVLALNPIELLRQARDSRRLSELRSIKQAISLALVLNPNLFVGTSTYVYISLPDNDGNGLCNEYSTLPPLASPWQYACVASSTFRKVNGTGWIPINFQNLSMVPLDALPVDPINVADSRCLYYRYVSNRELDAKMESSKYGYGGSQDVESVDGGDEFTIYETGFDLKTAPSGSCLVKLLTPPGEIVSFTISSDVFSRFTIPGTGTAMVTKLWFFRSALSIFVTNTLSQGESLELAIYSGGPLNYTKITGGSVIINGNDDAVSSWLSVDLPNPITITLGQTYVFGLGPAVGTTYQMYGDNGGNGYDPSYPPAEGSYFDGGSNDGVLANSINFVSGSNTKWGGFGISYAP